MKQRKSILAVLLATCGIQMASSQTVAQAWQAFRCPQDTARTKVWWFHGALN